MQYSFGSFLIAASMCLVLISLSVLIFYDLMRFVWRWLRKHEHQPRTAAVVGIVSVFICHSAVVWMYGITYWVLVEYMEFGQLHGPFDNGRWLIDMIYFSVTTYSSLGFGDVYPTGPIRLIVGVEAINGLILIGWSVTYSYFAIQHYTAHEKMLQHEESKHHIDSNML